MKLVVFGLLLLTYLVLVLAQHVIPLVLQTDFFALWSQVEKADTSAIFPFSIMMGWIGFWAAAIVYSNRAVDERWAKMAKNTVSWVIFVVGTVLFFIYATANGQLLAGYSPVEVSWWAALIASTLSWPWWWFWKGALVFGKRR